MNATGDLACAQWSCLLPTVKHFQLNWPKEPETLYIQFWIFKSLTLLVKFILKLVTKIENLEHCGVPWQWLRFFDLCAKGHWFDSLWSQKFSIHDNIPALSITASDLWGSCSEWQKTSQEVFDLNDLPKLKQITPPPQKKMASIHQDYPILTWYTTTWSLGSPHNSDNSFAFSNSFSCCRPSTTFWHSFLKWMAFVLRKVFMSRCMGVSFSSWQIL